MSIGLVIRISGITLISGSDNGASLEIHPR